MKCRRVTCFTDFESDQILPKKGVSSEIASLQKLKTM